jgi:hypothetical protein
MMDTGFETLNHNLTLTLHVRCPSCLKLFAVRAAEVAEPKPKFQCTSCAAGFWFPFEEALRHPAGFIGFPVLERSTEVISEVDFEAPELLAKPFQCPKCGAGYAGGQLECESCGVVFAKFFERAEADRDMTAVAATTAAAVELRRDPNGAAAVWAPPASRELKDAWSAVIERYDSDELHQAFLNQAWFETALDFARFKYSQVLSVNPSDAQATKHLDKIKALMMARIESKVPVKEKVGEGLGLPQFRWGTLMMFLCGVVIVLGLLMPGARNLVGMGCAFLFMILALRYYFRAI